MSNAVIHADRLGRRSKHPVHSERPVETKHVALRGLPDEVPTVKDRVVALERACDARVGEDLRRILRPAGRLELVVRVGSELSDNGGAAVHLLEQFGHEIGLGRMVDRLDVELWVS